MLDVYVPVHYSFMNGNVNMYIPEEFKADIEVFGQGVLHGMVDLLKLIKKHEIEIDDFIEWRAEQYEVNRKSMELNESFRKKVQSKLKTCDECGSTMAPMEVNNTPGTMIGGSYKSQWYCRDCGHAVFSKKTPQALMKAIGISKRFLKVNAKQQWRLRNGKWNRVVPSKRGSVQ